MFTGILGVAPPTAGTEGISPLPMKLLTGIGDGYKGQGPISGIFPPNPPPLPPLEPAKTPGPKPPESPPLPPPSPTNGKGLG